MEESRATKKCTGFLAFFLGFVVSCAFLWVAFPKVIYSEKKQPIRFSHKIHKEKAGMECSACHFFRDDGSYAGLPTSEKCGECHADVINPEDKDEVKFVTEYVKKGKEVPWLIYQYQPDNVFFSHKAHDGQDCVTCHPAVGESDTPPAHKENILSGYSASTMRMYQCERCHAENNVSNACYVCHK
jgi:hypothetical protein